MRHPTEVDCRLDVIADALALRTVSKASRRAAINAIVDLLPTLREHAAHLDDSNDPHGPLPATITNEIRHLTT